MTNPLIDSGTDVRNIYHQHPSSVSEEFVKAGGWEKGLTAVEAGEEMGAVSADYAATALAALRNVLDGVYGELSALAESKHAEVAS